MGTESEALRWKQWIDRWIKISAPEPSTPTPIPISSPSSILSSFSSSGSSSKIDPTSLANRKSFLSSEQLQYQLINMVKEGDPIFCEGLSKELLNNVTNYRLVIKCLSDIDTSERARSFFCQIIFYLCKCPSPSVRKFLTSLVPTLILNHLILSSGQQSKSQSQSQSQSQSNKSKENDKDESGQHINSIEIALLALYQADINNQPEPGNVKVPSLQSPSLYHSGFKTSDSFPYNVSPSLIHPPLHLYPTVPIVKITDYTKFIIYYRLCKSFQDFMPSIPEISLLIYSLTIERFVSGNTLIEDLEGLEYLFVTQISNHQTPSHTTSQLHLNQHDYLASSSTLSLSASHSQTMALRHLDSDDWKFVKRIISSVIKLKIRSAPHEDLYLLWCDFIIFVGARHKTLSEFVKKQILNRGKMELFPQIIMTFD